MPPIPASFVHARPLPPPCSALQERLGEAESARSALLGRLAAEEAALARSTETLRERVSALQREKGALEVGMEAEQEALVHRMGRQVAALGRERDAALAAARGALERLRSSVRGGGSAAETGAGAAAAATAAAAAAPADVERAIDAALAELAALPRLTSPLGQPLPRLSAASRSPVPSPRSPVGRETAAPSAAAATGGATGEGARLKPISPALPAGGLGRL
jgi:hypothetical protein